MSDLRPAVDVHRLIAIMIIGGTAVTTTSRSPFLKKKEQILLLDTYSGVKVENTICTFLYLKVNKQQQQPLR